MSKKSFVIILILSVVTTITLSLSAFVIGNYSIAKGFPFEWSSFNFLGSDTNYSSLFLDIAFWFIVIWGIWRLFLNRSKAKK